MEPAKTEGSPIVDANRLRKLERTQRGLVVAVALLSSTAGVVLLAGAKQDASKETVMASRFVLMGKDGRVRGSLGVTAEGTAALNLLGPAGGPLPISLSVGANGKPAINLNDRDGHSIALMIEEVPIFSMDAPDENAITLMCDKHSPSLILGDKNGQIGLARRTGAGYMMIVVKDGGNVLFRSPPPPK